MAERLAIIVPYRDRAEHLGQFVPHMRDYLTGAKLDYTIHIIEQSQGKPFNRGAVKNIGFKLAETFADYVCLHDVDYLPIKADYSPVDCPMLLISQGTTLMEDPNTFFGAIVAFPKADFIKVNGYPNAYWQWGFEDAELRDRCVMSGLTVGSRNGVFKSLPHQHSGYTSQGALTPEAVESRDRYFRRKRIQRAMILNEGLSSVMFTLRKTESDNDVYYYRVEIID
jgi:hypothetical protein